MDLAYQMMGGSTSSCMRGSMCHGKPALRMVMSSQVSIQQGTFRNAWLWRGKAICMDKA